MHKRLVEILGEKNVYLNEPLKKHSTFRIGGMADFLVTPDDNSQLLKLFKLIQTEKTPYIIEK